MTRSWFWLGLYNHFFLSFFSTDQTKWNFSKLNIQHWPRKERHIYISLQTYMNKYYNNTNNVSIKFKMTSVYIYFIKISFQNMSALWFRSLKFPRWPENLFWGCSDELQPADGDGPEVKKHSAAVSCIKPSSVQQWRDCEQVQEVFNHKN